MTLKQALATLKSLGSAPTRKTYGRHGVTGDLFGVKYGDMRKVASRIKQDHDLALALWDSGNHDARVLATMIADPDRLDARVLARWIKDVDNHVLSSAFAGIARQGAAGRKLMPKWMASRAEWPAATGWMMLAGLLPEGGVVTPAEAREHLATITKEIHDRPNRVKYSMNTALIALGAFIPGLEEEAVRAARQIGQVEVDHGLTNCETPLAEPYIRKSAAHARAKVSKTAGNQAPKRKPKRRTPADA